MAKVIVVPQGTNGFFRAAVNTGLYWQGAKSPNATLGRGKDRASARDNMRNAG